MDTANIKVHLRIRPAEGSKDANCLVPDEGSANGVLLLPTGPLSLAKVPDTFHFDTIQPSETGQSKIFSDVVRPQLDALFLGINVSVLCYGMTGSGKTHTIIGQAGEDEGIIPRAMRWIFEEISSKKSAQPLSMQTEYKCSVQVIEVYNEELRDLQAGLHGSIIPLDGMGGSKQPRLADSEDNYSVAAADDRVGGRESLATISSLFSQQSSITSSTSSAFSIASSHSQNYPIAGVQRPMRILEDEKTGSVWCDGASTVQITSAEDAISLLHYGLATRVVARTDCNERSSRSHLVFSVSVSAVNALTGEATCGKLTLVDLAGSENVAMSGATRERKAEAGKINRSLLALGKVINTLVTTRSQAAHIPYRDSKLTHLLQDSLGGNALTSLILTASPRACDIVQTKATLQFGARAKLVRTNPRTNVVKSSLQTNAELLTAIAQLRKFEVAASKLEQLVMDMNQYGLEKFGCNIMNEVCDDLGLLELLRKPAATDGWKPSAELPHLTPVVHNEVLSLQPPMATQWLTPVRTSKAHPVAVAGVRASDARVRASYLAATATSAAKVHSTSRRTLQTPRTALCEDTFLASNQKVGASRAVVRALNTPSLARSRSMRIPAATEQKPAVKETNLQVHFETAVLQEALEASVAEVSKLSAAARCIHISPYALPPASASARKRRCSETDAMALSYFASINVSPLGTPMMRALREDSLLSELAEQQLLSEKLQEKLWALEHDLTEAINERNQMSSSAAEIHASLQTGMNSMQMVSTAMARWEERNLMQVIDHEFRIGQCIDKLTSVKAICDDQKTKLQAKDDEIAALRFALNAAEARASFSQQSQSPSCSPFENAARARAVKGALTEVERLAKQWVCCVEQLPNNADTSDLISAYEKTIEALRLNCNALGEGVIFNGIDASAIIDALRSELTATQTELAAATNLGFTLAAAMDQRLNYESKLLDDLEHKTVSLEASKMNCLDLISQLQQAACQTTLYARRASQVEERNAELSQELDSLNAHFGGLQREFNELHQLIISMTTKLAESEKVNTLLESQVDMSNAALEDACSQIELLCNRNADLESSIQTVNQQQRQLKAVMAEHEMQAHAMQEQIERQNSVREELLSLQVQHRLLMARHQEITAAGILEATEQSKQMNTFAEQIAQLELRGGELERLLELSRDESKALTRQNESLLARVMGLEAELLAASTRFQELQSTAEADALIHAREMSASCARYLSLEEKYHNALVAVQRLSTYDDNLRVEIQQTRMAAQKVGVVARLLLRVYRNTKTELKAKIYTASNMQRLTSRLIALEAAGVALRKHNSLLEKSLSQTVATISSELSCCRTENSTLQSTIVALTHTLQEAQEEVGRQKSISEQRRLEIGEAKGALQALEAVAAAAGRTMVGNESELAKMAMQMDRLAAALREEQGNRLSEERRAEQAESQLCAVQQQLQGIESQSQHNTKAHSECQARIQALLAEQVALQDRYASSARALHSLRQAMAAAKDAYEQKLAAESASRAAAEDQLVALSNDLREAKESLHTLSRPAVLSPSRTTNGATKVAPPSSSAKLFVAHALKRGPHNRHCTTHRKLDYDDENSGAHSSSPAAAKIMTSSGDVQFIKFTSHDGLVTAMKL